MSSSHYKYDDDYRPSRRHRDEADVSSRGRSRSRSRSADRHRRRRNRSSRSRSRDCSYHHKSSRRHRRSHSRSRSRSTHQKLQHNRSSRSPKRPSHKYDEEKRRSRSHSKDRNRSSSKKHPENESREREFHRVATSEGRKVSDDEENNSQSSQYYQNDESLQNLPLPDQTESNSYDYYDDSQEPIDKERIHREMEEKLRLALAKEGKVYPPPKAEASHPVFANDGSFLEIFKKMQEAQQAMTVSTASAVPTYAVPLATSSSTISYATASAVTAPPPPPPPAIGRRRGVKILKTGVVAKPKNNGNGNDDSNDFWSLYLAEVNKYKNNACELDSGNRPLLK